MKKRLFLAIQLPEDMRQDLGKYKRMVNIPGTSWVPAPNLHVTAYFLGDVNEKDIAALSIDVRTAVAGCAPFTLVPRQIIFASPNNPTRMVWLQFNGCQDFTNVVAKSYKVVAHYLNGQPPYDEDRVAPHVTMARLTRPPLPNTQLPQIGLPQVQVSSIDLIESDLQPGGAQYMVLETFALQG